MALYGDMKIELLMKLANYPKIYNVGEVMRDYNHRVQQWTFMKWFSKQIILITGKQLHFTPGVKKGLTTAIIAVTTEQQHAIRIYLLEQIEDKKQRSELAKYWANLSPN